MDIGIINTVGVAMVSVVLMLVRVVWNGDKRRHEFSTKVLIHLKPCFAPLMFPCAASCIGVYDTKSRPIKKVVATEFKLPPANKTSTDI